MTIVARSGAKRLHARPAPHVVQRRPCYGNPSTARPVHSPGATPLARLAPILTCGASITTGTPSFRQPLYGTACSQSRRASATRPLAYPDRRAAVRSFRRCAPPRPTGSPCANQRRLRPVPAAPLTRRRLTCPAGPRPPALPPASRSCGSAWMSRRLRQKASRRATPRQLREPLAARLRRLGAHHARHGCHPHAAVPARQLHALPPPRVVPVSQATRHALNTRPALNPAVQRSRPLAVAVTAEMPTGRNTTGLVPQSEERHRTSLAPQSEEAGPHQLRGAIGRAPPPCSARRRTSFAPQS